MPKKTHNGSHQYERLETKRGKVIYKCMIPSCTHFLSTPELVQNRLSRCWGECGREIVITKELYQDKIKKPLCDTCKEERKVMREMLAAVPIKGEE